MPQGVRQEVEQHPLDLLRRAARGDVVRHARGEVDPSPSRIRLDAAQAGLDHRLERCSAELEGERARVDACQLEEIVDERREDTDLLAEHGKGRLGLDEAVLERLEHGLHVGKRRAEIVARPRDELTASVEESLEALRHLVERGGQVGDLGRPRLGRSHREIAAGERAEASRTRSTEPTIECASTSPATIATVADAAETARIFTSSPMWKATQPDSRTEVSGRQTESAASPASCNRRLGSRRSRSTATRPTASVSRPTAIAVPIIATGITGRPGSRRPRPSGGGAGPRDRPRSSRAAGARGR